MRQPLCSVVSLSSPTPDHTREQPLLDRRLYYVTAGTNVRRGPSCQSQQQPQEERFGYRNTHMPARGRERGGRGEEITEVCNMVALPKSFPCLVSVFHLSQFISAQGC